MVWFRWSARAIKSYAIGELEARKLKYPNTRTNALLMGILVEGLLVTITIGVFLISAIAVTTSPSIVREKNKKKMNQFFPVF